MRASGYGPLAALLIMLASPAGSEIIKLKCVDAHGVPVVQYVIDTHRPRAHQILAGAQIIQPIVTSITETYVRFIDRSGGAPTINRLNRATGELASEIMEGPERGVSVYLTCRRSDR